MRKPKAFVLVAVATIAGVAGAGLTAVVTAGASGSSVTYYACLSTRGGLSKVGTTAPTCTSKQSQISWGSQGPQGIQGIQGAIGPQGPQGPAGPTQNTCVTPPGPGLNYSGCVYGSFDGNDWNGVNVTGANFTSAAPGGSLNYAVAANADFYYASLSGDGLSGTNFTNANFTNANMGNTNLTDANLTDANLTGVNLGASNLNGANVTGATFANDYWYNTTCPNGANSGTGPTATCIGQGI